MNKKKPETETVDLQKRGLFLGKLSMPESKGELILAQNASSKIIEPLREEIGAQGKSLITANPDELTEMQTLDAQIAQYRAEVLQRGVSELELDTLIQRVVDNILGTKLERRSVLQGMKHFLLHRRLIRDVLDTLTKRPMVQIRKSVAYIMINEKVVFQDVCVDGSNKNVKRHIVKLVDENELILETGEEGTFMYIESTATADSVFKTLNIAPSNTSSRIKAVENKAIWVSQSHITTITSEVQELCQLRGIPHIENLISQPPLNDMTRILLDP